MSNSSKHQLKLTITDEGLWERLQAYAYQMNQTPDEVALRFLKQRLPDPLRGFPETYSKLTREERHAFQYSFYTIVFLVSYADGSFSMKEKIVVEKEFQILIKQFGKKFARFLALSKDQKKAYAQTIKTMSPEMKIITLMEIRDVLDKLPDRLMENYKTALLGSALEVAQASKEHFFDSDPISDEERDMMYMIMLFLHISVEKYSAFFDQKWLDRYRKHIWKEKQSKKKVVSTDLDDF